VKILRLFHTILSLLKNELSISEEVSLDKKAVSIFILVPFCLTMIHYIGQYTNFRELLLNAHYSEIVKELDHLIYSTPYSNLGKLTYWVFNVVIFYFVIPALVIKFYFKEKLTDFGLQVKGAFKGYRLYLLMLLVMLPLVFYFSGTEAFQSRYPFLKAYHGEIDATDLLIWELMYCVQFFALEFFFRGFMTLGLQPKFGIYSIFIMTIPYCMIHFGKPLPETLAAIIAGIVLGFLSMKGKSIWLGFLIHCSVGITMDLASLWQKGNLNDYIK
jgi:uncharacterized protein